MRSPVICTTPFTAVWGSESGPADTTKLQNPFRVPMMVQEIRIRRTSGFAFNLARLPIDLGLRLRLGTHELTRGYVPVGCLGKVLNDEGVMGNGGYYSIVWRLPKPLYVPPSELLVPSFYTRPRGGAQADTPLEVSYAGYSLEGEPPPREVYLPWAAAYVPREVSIYQDPALNVQDVDVSSPADLPNPFDTVLNVQRFIGRYAIYDTENSLPDLTSNRTMITASDSNGTILVRDPTPFTHLFQYTDRCWTVNATLPPKGFYRFRIDRDLSSYTPPVGTDTVFALAIGMVGWRTIPYRPS